MKLAILHRLIYIFALQPLSFVFKIFNFDVAATTHRNRGGRVAREPLYMALSALNLSKLLA